jgi:hypothetical protein
MNPETQAEKKNRADLAGFIMMRPELRIVPLVAEDVFTGEHFWSGGTLGKVEILRIIVRDERVYFESDEDELIERFMDEIAEDQPNVTEEHCEQLAEEQVKKLDWEEVILVKIN